MVSPLAVGATITSQQETEALQTKLNSKPPKEKRIVFGDQFQLRIERCDNNEHCNKLAEVAAGPHLLIIVERKTFDA